MRCEIFEKMIGKKLSEPIIDKQMREFQAPEREKAKEQQTEIVSGIRLASLYVVYGNCS